MTPGLPQIITPHWIDLGSHLLSNIFPNTHPALAMLRASHDKPHPGISVPIGTAAKKGPLALLANGLNSMERIAEVAKGGRMPLGPWCQSAPPGQAGDVRAVCNADQPPGLRTLGDLQRLRHQSDSNNAALNRLWDATPINQLALHPPLPGTYAPQRTGPQPSQPSSAAWAGREDSGHGFPSPKPRSGLQHGCSSAPSGATATAMSCDMPRQPCREHQRTRREQQQPQQTRS